MEYEAKHKLVIMLSVLSGMFLSALDQTIVSTALPKIVASLGGIELFTWIVSAYLLTSTATVIIYGKLSDIYGRKKLFITGIGIFLAGSILSGISQNIIQLIIFRGIQGIGGGAIMANAVAIIGDLFPPAERGKWQGLIGGTFGMASIIGPALGGLITDTIGWHWIFFINIPIGLFSIILLMKFLPEIAGKKEVSIDYKGSVTIIAVIVAMVLALFRIEVAVSAAYIWQGLALFAVAGVLLVVFVKIENKAREPILPISIFQNKVLLICAMATFTSTMAMFGASLYIPLFAQTVLGKTATSSGLILTAMVAGNVFASTLSGQFISRKGKYKFLAIMGYVVASIALVLFSIMTDNISNLRLMINLLIFGLGLGVTFPIFVVAAQNAFEHSKLGVVTASLQLFRNLGGIVGIAIFGVVMMSSLNTNSVLLTLPVQLRNPEALLESGVLNTFSQQQILSLKSAMSASITHVFLVAAIAMSVTLVALFFLKENPLRKTHTQTIEQVGEELAEEEGVPFKDVPEV